MNDSSNLAFFFVRFDARSPDATVEVSRNFYSDLSRKKRRSMRIMPYPSFTGDVPLFNPASCKANPARLCDMPDGLDLNRHMGKPGDFGDVAQWMVSKGEKINQGDDKQNAIPNRITNINPCLWIERAPTTAVYI